MEPREDDINEFLISKTEDIERKYISKASLLMYEDMRYTKNHVEKERVDKSFVTSFYYYTDVDEWEARAFFDAFVMAYFPNILKRDKDPLGIDELYDVYGNKILVQENFSEVKEQNLGLYLSDLFEGFYAIRDKFNRDCKYDKEDDILWS